MALAAHVEACRFFRYGCNEESHALFQPAYSRSNRTRGTKILRCFPHCCPDHMPRRYCGCSIHVLVTFSHGLERQFREDELVVCARFEASSPGGGGDGSGFEDVQPSDEAVLLPVGHTVHLPNYLFDLSDGNEGVRTWIRGVKEAPAKQQQAPPNSVIYSLNKHAFPMWIYNYESGATKRQREMLHHLRVYVLRLLPPPDDHGSRASGRGYPHLAVVEFHHASPGFTIISYRRAPTVHGRLDRLAAVAASSMYEDVGEGEGEDEGEGGSGEVSGPRPSRGDRSLAESAAAAQAEGLARRQLSVQGAPFPWDAAERRLRLQADFDGSSHA